MNNKYFDKLNEVQAKYGAVLKEAMASCRRDIIEASEIYNAKAVRRKQEEILAKYQKKINDIQQQYIDEVENMVATEGAKIHAMQDNKPKDNMARLVEALELNNKIQMNQVKMATMNEAELFKLMENQQDEVIFDLAKNAIYNLSKDMENGAELRQKARMMNLVTEESMLQEVIANVRLDIANRDMLLPGFELSDTLIVNKIGGIQAFIAQDMEALNPNEEAK